MQKPIPEKAILVVLLASASIGLTLLVCNRNFVRDSKLSVESAPPLESLEDEASRAVLVRGDFNRDGIVTEADIKPSIDAWLDHQGFLARMDDLSSEDFKFISDINLDGKFDDQDVSRLKAILVRGVDSTGAAVANGTTINSVLSSESSAITPPPPGPGAQIPINQFESRIANHGKLAVGMNLSGVSDWNREWVFVDVFKHSRPWISQDTGGRGAWDNGKEIDLNKYGYPILKDGQAAATLMFRDMDGHYPAGVYTCTYSGTGELRFGLDAKVVEAKANRILLDVTPKNGGIYMRIDRSDPGDPVRDIHIWMPGFENAKSPFHPLFIKRLRPFLVIRFMGWARVNNSTVAKWRDRRTLEDCRQSGSRGVALEYMIDLCNELGAVPWFCMPHLADDNFVRNYALLVRDRLRQDLPIYVEWSNEAWNSIFAQAKWVNKEAEQRRILAPDVIADEALRDWRIWQKVFGSKSSRIIRVAAGQHYRPWVAETILKRLNGEFDAVSCAAYFGPHGKEESRFNKETTAKDVLKISLKKLHEEGVPLLRKHKALAEKWSKNLRRRIPLLAYEGGQHLVTWGKNVPYADTYFEAQTHPMMYQCYADLLNLFFNKVGGELFVALTYVAGHGRSGSWGHLQYQDEPLDTAPKFKALVDAVGGEL